MPQPRPAGILAIMRYFIVDVFTDEIFKGNQLAVVLDADGLSDGAMQAIAAEFNFSETTFVLTSSSERAAKRVRIFTPALELPLAGHPVVGTWYLLASQKLVPVKEGWTTFYQELQAGILPVEVLLEAGRVQQVRMTQAKPEYFEIVSDDRLLHALGLSFADIDNTLPAQFVSTGVKQLMLPLQSRAALQRIQPVAADLARLLADRDSHLVYVFAEDAGTIYARGFFAAGAAMFEDAATGSAAGALGAYLWKHRSVAAPFSIRQGIEMGRSAKIDVEVSEDGRTVKVGGTAVIVASGELFL
jgi:trans-2,3-dihydro-3-hydroxyanthranilate isomerase